jgi:hypothetical protein
MVVRVISMRLLVGSAAPQVRREDQNGVGRGQLAVELLHGGAGRMMPEVTPGGSAPTDIVADHGEEAVEKVKEMRAWRPLGPGRPSRALDRSRRPW